MPVSLRPIESDAAAAGERRPKYKLVCDHIYAELRAGRLAPGQSLPPEAKLSEILGVSRNTLRQALGKLEDDGMVERVQGRGTFLTSELQRESRKKRDAFAFLAPEIQEGSYPALIHGFEKGCSGFQHQMVVCKSSNDLGRQADQLMQLIDQEVGGVALVPATTPTPAHQLNLLQKNFIPVVCCHRTVLGVTTPSVVFSGFENGHKAAQAFLERGHRRIAYMFSHRYSMVDEREAGMRAALAAHRGGESCQLELTEYGQLGSLNDPSARKAIGTALRSLLAGSDRPTAIFCGSLNEAEQAYLQAGELGMNIPHDLSLLYVGSTWRESALAQRISCVCVNEHDIGASAAQLLHEMRTGKRALDNNEQIVFPTSLFVGETLGEI